MPAVKFLARLDLEENSSFPDGNYLDYPRSTKPEKLILYGNSRRPKRKGRRKSAALCSIRMDAKFKL